MRWLHDLRVIDLSTGIPGAYATKLLADAGADVVKVEPPGGDPLRRWSSTGADLHFRDGALFQFLHTSKRSVVGGPNDAEVRGLVEGADLAVESFERDVLDSEALCAASPGLVLLSITPFGRCGPYAGRPASEFTVQAECGSIGARGLPERLPFMAGGRTTEWVGGTFAAVAALAAVQRASTAWQAVHRAPPRRAPSRCPPSSPPRTAGSDSTPTRASSTATSCC
jgi:crotonobetainyl-CoA:carnitine CoA-transferase CaiB-like acyl-CoA transferase